MSISRFGWWARGLTDVELAFALAAAGVLNARTWDHYVGPISSEGDYRRLADEVSQAFARNSVVRWQIYNSPEDLSQLTFDQRILSGRVLATLWQQSSHAGRLAIDPESAPAADLLPWVVELLARPEVGLQAVYVAQPDAAASVTWHWPLRVGILDDPASQALAQALRGSYWANRLARIDTLFPASEPCDVLILPGTTTSALRDLLALEYSVRASSVVVLGDMRQPWPRERTLFAALQAQVDAKGLCRAPVPPTLRAAWFDEFLEQLSHNMPLDVAFSAAARTLGLGASLFTASPRLLENATLSAFVKRFARRLGDLPADTKLVVSEPPVWPVGMALSRGATPPQAPLSPQEFMSRLLQEAEFFRYDSESHEATAVAELVAAVEATAPPLVPVTPRWLQGQMFILGNEREPERMTRGLVANTDHLLVVRVGPGEESWLTTPSAAVFPDYQLDWNEEVHDLQVVFTEPNHAPVPQTAVIRLPRTGPSTTCQFWFRPLSGCSDFKARIIVLHRNRILQTALLQGKVMESSTLLPEDTPLAFALEGVIRPQLAGLDSGQDFDLALVANHDDLHTMGLTTIAQERAGFRRLTHLEKVIQEIKADLDAVVLDPKKFWRGLKTKNNLVLLRGLAIKGSQLYAAIIQDQIGEERLQGIRRIQLVSAVDEYLPLEFFYTRPAPKEEAKLCPKAAEALETGECAHCLATATPKDYVCPLGFLGLSHVIERHYVDPERTEALSGYDFAVQSEPLPTRQTLRVLAGALYAASERVDLGIPGGVQQILHTLDEATEHHTAYVTDWRAWTKAIEQKHPSLLVLLPHTLRGGPYNSLRLEIGADKQLPVTDIEAAYVRPKSNDPGPVVFLLGCETLVPSETPAGFAAQFRRNGSAIVLSTFTPVLGRHAVPVAEALIRELERVQTTATAPTTFGDALLTVRRRILAQGLPMVMAVLAYGDAHWLLETKQKENPHV